MGTCKYCHKDAGWLSSKHLVCEEKNNQGRNEIKAIIRNSFDLKKDFFIHKAQIDNIIATSFIDHDALVVIYRELLDEAVTKFLNDGIIDKKEESSIARFIQFTEIPQNTLNTTHALDKVVQSRILQDILQGNPIKQVIAIVGEFPFMLAKNETLVWLYRNTILHEQKIKREYVGRSRGLNIRIAKGVYYRTGSFKGSPIETNYMQKVGVGCVCLTDKNMYFSSMERSLKVPYSKIISIESYSNGIGIQREGTNSKPIFLEGVSSWFCYNVISNLKNI